MFADNIFLKIFFIFTFLSFYTAWFPMENVTTVLKDMQGEYEVGF